MRGEGFDAPPLRHIVAHERHRLHGFMTNGAQHLPPWRIDSQSTFLRFERKRRDRCVKYVWGKRFEDGEEKGVRPEVFRPIAGGGGSDSKFVKGRPEAFYLTFSQAQYLDLVGVNPGGEVVRREAVGEESEVLPEHVLDQIVSVGEDRGDRHQTFRLISNGCTWRDEDDFAGPDRLLRAEDQ